MEVPHDATLSPNTTDYNLSKGLDELIKNCALAQELRADSGFTKSRLKMNRPALQSLLGHEKLVVPPYH